MLEAGRLMAAGAALALGAALASAPPGGATIGRAALALRWAPIHYQDVDTTGSHAAGGRADYLAAVDFDGNLDGRDNWDHVDTSRLAAHAYYAVVETSTHWYLTYFFFHPRDWTDDPFFESEHENDGEGVLLAIERDGSTYGALRAAVTVSHSDFYSYAPAGSTWTAGHETVDGTLQLQSSPHDQFAHPVTAQETQGHGLKAYPQFTIDGEGLVHYPSTVAEEPTDPDDRDVRYRLVDLFAPGGLWAQRANGCLFADDGRLAGDSSGGCGSGTWRCLTDSADAPWSWDDGDDLPRPGELASDPAKLVTEYFTIPGDVSRAYTYNPYATV